MIIVSGKLKIAADKRTDFIIASVESIKEARNNPECSDFAVSPDPVELDRVNIYEEWSSKAALDEFRGSGLMNNLYDLVESFDVNQREVNESPTVTH